jgi:hypothetical protein
VDDLNGDGRSDVRDAEVLYRLIDRGAARPEAQGLIGGLGKYPSRDQTQSPVCCYWDESGDTPESADETDAL